MTPNDGFSRHLPCCGLLAGALVGACDGLRAAVAASLDARGTAATVLLVAALDAICGLAAGGGLALAVGIFAWGRKRNPTRGSRALAWMLVGGLAAAAATVATIATASRVNRFLAGGVVVLTSAFAVMIGLVVARAIAVVLARDRSAAKDGWSPAPSAGAGRVLLAPIALLLIEAVVFLLIWRTRAPLRRGAMVERAAWAALLSGFAPFLLARVAALPARLSHRIALPLCGVLLAGPMAAVVVLRWETDFRYLPWRHMLTGLAILANGAALAWYASRRIRVGSRRGLTVGLVAVAALAMLAAADSEPARKAATAHSGLAGPALIAMRRALDFDRDGFPRLLGGGDCSDSDPAINPAALDPPGDGIDQDCDGEDASAQRLESPPYDVVPDAVPRDLNILFIAIDTLRADHLGCYGYRKPTSPTLDRLAAEGAVFTNAWAHAPSTRYSMPAIVTGRWPSAIEWQDCIGCASWWPRLGPGMRTIGQALHDMGYFTAAFWAYGYFDRNEGRGFERGIDIYDTRRAALHTNVAGPAESIGSSAREIADDGIAFLDDHAGRKFFATLHFYDPHLSYEAHAGAPDFGSGTAPPGESDRYDQEIWFSDQQVGRVFDRLRTLGLWDRTVIVVTGDHGEGLGERGIAAHGYHLYPPQTKVPLLVRVPGLAPRRIPDPVGHVDIAPTLVNLARGHHQPSFLGRSLVGRLAGRAPEDKAQADGDATAAPVVFQEVSYEGDNKKRALVTRTHQLIWNWTPHNTTECYDLRSGASEPPDLWGRAAGEPVCTALKKRLRLMIALLSLR